MYTEEERIKAGSKLCRLAGVNSERWFVAETNEWRGEIFFRPKGPKKIETAPEILVATRKEVSCSTGNDDDGAVVAWGGELEYHRTYIWTANDEGVAALEWWLARIVRIEVARDKAYAMRLERQARELAEWRKQMAEKKATMIAARAARRGYNPTNCYGAVSPQQEPEPEPEPEPPKVAVFGGAFDALAGFGR